MESSRHAAYPPSEASLRRLGTVITAFLGYDHA